MAAKTTVVENQDGSRTIYVKPDIIGIFGEIVGCIGGIACGGFAAMKVAKMVGPAVTTAEKVGKYIIVGSAGMATEYYVSEGIAGMFDEVSEISDMAAEKIRAKSQRIVQELAEEQPVQATQQKTTKK